LPTPVFAGILKPMKTGWKKLITLFLLSAVLPLGQAQEDGGG